VTAGPAHGDLEEYRRKRDFALTPEPAPAEAAAPAPDAPRFVVQRHDARALHYDLRLEMGGALASWAVPKGPPLREGIMRMAVRTEDHPLEYLDFSAVIPEGQYGAGRMTIWDRGTYAVELIAEKEWKLVLDGALLRGHYHLVRTSRASRGKQEWLLFRSAKGPPGAPDPLERFRALRPMPAEPCAEAFDDPGFGFELRWDGHRALCLTTSEGSELRDGAGRDLTPAHPALADLRRVLLCQEAVLDGAVVALDATGRADREALVAGRAPVSYMAFDLLYLDGAWLLDRPWEERRALLARVVAPEGPPRLMHSDHVLEHGRALYEAAAARGVGGVVAKRLGSAYRPGVRTSDWMTVGEPVAATEPPAPDLAPAPPLSGPAAGTDTRQTGRLADGPADRTIASGGRSVRLTNLGKPYWPEEGIAKGDLLEHYLRVAEVLVPHLAGRPLILKRYPNGIGRDFFFQHNLPDNAPAWLATADLSRSGRPGSETNRYGMVDDPMGLLWVINLGCIDLNPWQSLAATPDQPTQVLFDLDPNEGVPFAKVVEVALMIREELEALGLRGYPKTTGATGMHIFLPVTPGLSFEVVRLFAHVVAQRLIARRPDLVTVEGLIAKRGPRVYLDANQNGRGRSISCVYSVRPRPGAPVAAPLEWDEVDARLDPRDLTMAVVARRVAERGDLFAGALGDLQELAPAVARLSGGG
jgi:bifunctional non-homologous end joining protein LigD